MRDDEGQGGGDIGLTLALALCGVLADAGLTTMTAIADKLDDMADHEEARNPIAAAKTRHLAQAMRDEVARATN